MRTREGAAKPGRKAAPKKTYDLKAPLGRADAPLTKARSDARKKVRDTETKAVRSGKVAPKVELKRFPKLERYTPAQRKAIRTEQAKAIEKHVDRKAKTPAARVQVRKEIIDDVRKLGDKDTREQLAKLEGVNRTNTARLDERVGRTRLKAAGIKTPTRRQAREEGERNRPTAEVKKTDARDTKVAGLPIGAVAEDLADRVGAPGTGTRKALRLARVPAEVARETIENPGSALKANTNFVKGTLGGIVTAPIDFVRDPEKAVKNAAEDYKDFYGPALEGDWGRFRKNVREEGGLRVALDAATVGTGASAAAGGLAKTGALGAKAKTVMTAPRPAKRLSGGDAGAKPQRVSGRLGKAALQRRKDTKLTKAQTKAVTEAQAGGKRADALQVKAVANTKAGRPEVAPKGGSKTLASQSFRFQKRAVAKLNARARLGQRADVDRVDREARQRVNELTPAERRALAYVGQGMVSPDPARAPAQIADQLTKIKEEREARNFKVEGSLKKTDQVPELEWLRANADKAFTPRLQAVVEELSEMGRRVADEDPRLRDEQARARRLGPQAYALGMRRGEDIPVPGPDVETPQRRAKLLAQRLGERGDVQAFDPAASAKAIQRHERKLARAVPNRDFKPKRDYRPDPDSINATKWYHGTAAIGLRPEGLDGLQTNELGLFGPGVYLTSDPAIAQSYAKARAAQRRERRDPYTGKVTPAGKPQHYEAKLNVKNPLDMESPVDPKFAAILERHAPDFYRDGEPAELRGFREALAAGKSNGEVFRAWQRDLKEEAADNGWARTDLMEFLHDVPGALRAAGWDALTHVGGNATNANRKHQVVIALDPSNMLAHNQPNPVAGFGRTATPQELASAEAATLADALRPAATAPRQSSYLEQLREAGSRPALPGNRYDPDETFDAFEQRVRERAREEGLVENPLYWRSERYAREDDPQYGDYALGRVPMRPDQRWSGTNMRLGLGDTSTDTLLGGMARSVKAKHNWRFFEDAFEDHKLYDQPMPLRALRDKLARDGVDLSTVTLVSPTIFRKAARDTDAPNDRHLDEDDLLKNDAGAALDEATLDVDRLARLQDDDPRYSQQWLALPKAAGDEIKGTVPSYGTGHSLGRAWDIAKGKQSRALLLTGNLPWLQFQVLSNALLTGVGTKGTALRDFVKAQAWYKDLTPEERVEVDRMVGSSAAIDANYQRRLGAVEVPTERAQRFVDSYRNLKQSKWWKPGANPLSRMAQADNAQNNVFRRAFLYDQARREAWSRMSKAAQDAMSVQDRMFKRAPDGEITKLVTTRKDAEKLGDAVDRWLGDYTSYTQAERAGLARFGMFYGFLRHSLQLAFRTLPMDSPKLALIAAQLGRLEADEVRNLLVAGVMDELDVDRDEAVKLVADDYQFNIGDLYLGDKKIDLAKANPMVNSLVSLSSPGQLPGLLPPAVGLGLNQIAKKDLYRGRPWKIQGETQARKDDQYPVEDVMRIGAQDALSLLYPYRLADSLTNPGPQGDDSLLWDPRPTNYKGGKDDSGRILRSNLKRQAETDAAVRQLQYELLPFLPRPQADVENAVGSAKYKLSKRPKGKRKRSSGGTLGLGGGAGSLGLGG